ncbi:unnamed protein product [Cylicostephanus goldi]|uniref:Uncharacterized protein n=1 Tax=Cylicostephanus goldi TaxID=71465 RepID=A0A3P6QIS6_CYLGO|nr:unnamed protein product [Cylicostephanus goldi]
MGHIQCLRSVFTLPLNDQEYRVCVDFGRFANQNLIPVIADDSDERVFLPQCAYQPTSPVGSSLGRNSPRGRYHSRSESRSPLKNKGECARVAVLPPTQNQPAADLRKLKRPTQMPVYAVVGRIPFHTTPIRSDRNNNDGHENQDTHPAPYDKNEDYMTDGYGCIRNSAKGRMRTNFSDHQNTGNRESGEHKGHVGAKDDDRFTHTAR